MLESFFSWLFPMREQAKIVARLRECDVVLGDSQAATEHHHVLPYQNPAVRACITEAKFHKNKRAIQILAHALSKYLLDKGPVIIIPIPLSAEREKERGYNQVTEVARLVVENNPAITILPNTLVRTRHTEKQTALPRAERLKNVAGAFGAGPDLPHLQELISQPTKQDTSKKITIIILDDVTTTGATLGAAKHTLHTALLPHLTQHPSRHHTLTTLALAH